jgi:hypothetical protein
VTGGKAYETATVNTQYTINCQNADLETPISWVTWYKDDVNMTLPDLDRYEGANVTEPSLTFRKVRKKDAGRYICSLGNQDGFTNSTVSTLIVKCKYIQSNSIQCFVIAIFNSSKKMEFSFGGVYKLNSKTINPKEHSTHAYTRTHQHLKEQYLSLNTLMLSLDCSKHTFTTEHSSWHKGLCIDILVGNRFFQFLTRWQQFKVLTQRMTYKCQP